MATVQSHTGGAAGRHEPGSGHKRAGGGYVAVLVLLFLAFAVAVPGVYEIDSGTLTDIFSAPASGA